MKQEPHELSIPVARAPLSQTELRKAASHLWQVKRLKEKDKAANEPSPKYTAEMWIAMSQSSSSPAGANVFCGSLSAPAFFEDGYGYQLQLSWQSISPDEPTLNLNKASLLFNDSPMMQRTTSKSGDTTTS